MDENGLLQALSMMSPEEIQQLLQASNVPNRSALIQDEWQAAQGFGQPQSGHHITPGGAALGGLSDAVRGVSSAYQQKQLQDERRGLMDTLEDPNTARLTFGVQGAQQADELRKQKALIEMLRSGNMPAGGGAFMAPGLS